MAKGNVLRTVTRNNFGRESVACTARTSLRLPSGIQSCSPMKSTTNNCSASSAKTMQVVPNAAEIEREFFRRLDAVLDFDQKSDGFLSVDCSVIVTKREIHHRPNFHRPVHSNGSRHDFVHAEDSALRRIQNRCGEKRSVHSAVRDSECAALQIFDF